ncbi:MAG: TonB-dependent receptor, partial [Candidatus Omnitrophica bacterium]|nr:TonB-dependent receptor [Candidatus Omnitrophota bacterium]
MGVTFLAGYSYHEQNLRISEGFQAIPASGPFSGLNSTYQTEWKGPWLGFELEGWVKKYQGFVRLEYHWADYYAEADWNLRDDFAHPVSFTHEADARGLVFGAGGNYQVHPDWLVGLNFDLQNWETGLGLDRTYFSDGSTIDTQLNVSKWRSWAANLAATYRFW